MMSSNLGDLAQSKLLRRETASVKNELNRLGQELSSGRSSNLQKTLGGQFNSLAGLERALEMNAVFRSSNAAAARFAEGQQLALESVQGTLMSAGPEFLKIASTGEATQVSVTAKNARRQLDQIVSALNGRTGEQSLFSGAATNSVALTSTDDILTALEAAVVGLTNPSDIFAAADNWFDTPGGGFETVAYLGSDEALSDFDISDNERESLSLTAADPAIRDAIKDLATVALLDRGVLAGDLVAQKEVLKGAGDGLVSTTDRVTALRAELGFAQERIETTQTRSDAEIAGLQQARDLLVGVDPYETALRLQEVQTQLETIYAITARLSQLSLASVLR